MSDTLKKIISAIVILGFVGIGTGLYFYYKPHTNMANQQADLVFVASKLFAEFEADENQANEKYLNKIIEVSGKVQEIIPTDGGGSVVVLRGDEDMFGINCSFEASETASLSNLEVGKEVEIKGVCTGMLMDVNLSRCIMVNQ